MKNKKRSFKGHCLELPWFLFKLNFTLLESLFLHLKVQASSTLQWLKFLRQKLIAAICFLFDSEIRDFFEVKRRSVRFWNRWLWNFLFREILKNVQVNRRRFRQFFLMDFFRKSHIQSFTIIICENMDFLEGLLSVSFPDIYTFPIDRQLIPWPCMKRELF